MTNMSSSASGVLEHIYQEPQFGENWFSYSTIYKSVVELFPTGSKFVEVGCWKGKSAAFMAVEIANSGKDIEFYCVDHWLGGPDHQGWAVLPDLHRIWRSNMAPLTKYYTEMKKSSIEASQEFDNDSLEFVFIDASHEYEDVKADIEHWMPKVKEGGIIAGHDYDPGHPGVQQAVDELMEGKKFDYYEKCWIHKKL